MINKRNFIKASLFFTIIGISSFKNLLSESNSDFSKSKINKKIIAKTGQKVPSVGMGTWLTFDVGHNTKKILKRTEVLKKFFEYGGELIDSSPMYGTSERVIGKCLEKINMPYKLFSATKVWTPNTWHGKQQIKNSFNLWKVNKFDLIQVHNLVNYEDHLENLYELKRNKDIDYVGITTSHGWRHEKTIDIMKRYDLDFVQFTYNILDDEAEKYLLDLAFEKNISVIANRPFKGGNLFNYTSNKKLPSWAKEEGINNWACFFLKFITSHPSITCAIPATTNVIHMEENMKSMYGFIPDKKFRKKMKSYFKEL